ncbi:MAG: SRPBCC domain-containing protein [Methylocella sp.]
MSTKNSARAIADAGSGTILATVEIAAAPERVFRALTAPDEIVRWWGSDDAYRTTGFTEDLRAGGCWHAGEHRADGQPFSMEGEFLEVDFPRKLVQSWKADSHKGAVTTVATAGSDFPCSARILPLPRSSPVTPANTSPARTTLSPKQA